MSVRDSLPGSQVINLLKDVGRLSGEIKSPQTLGSSNVVNDLIKSSAQQDFTSSGNYVVDLFEITFTPSNIQFGGTFCYKLRIEHVLSNTSDNFGLYRLFVDSSGIQRWRFRVQDPSPAGYKLYFFAQGSGTFSVRKL